MQRTKLAWDAQARLHILSLPSPLTVSILLISNLLKNNKITKQNIMVESMGLLLYMFLDEISITFIVTTTVPNYEGFGKLF